MDERTHLAIVDIDHVASILNDPRQAVQYVGEKGFGKTTHLLAIRELLPGCGYVHIPEGERRSVPDGSPVLVDEAQRLTFFQRWKLFRQPRALLLGTHRDFHRQLERAGRIVTTIAANEQTSLGRLRQIVHERIEFARRLPGPVPSVPDLTLKRLLQSENSNIRSMLQCLYEQFQMLKSLGPVEWHGSGCVSDNSEDT